MSRDPRLVGLVTVRPQERTSNALQRVGVLERRTVGGGGGTGTVADATTTSKGKIQLAGHLAGTAGAPIIATTAEPQVAQLGIGVATQNPHAITVLSDSSTVKGLYVTNTGSYFDFDAFVTAQRLNVNYAKTSGRHLNFQSRITGKGTRDGTDGFEGFRSQMVDMADVTQKAITSINSSGVVSCTGHGYSADDRIAIWGTTQAGHNTYWTIASVGGVDEFTLTGAPAVASTGGTATNAPLLYAFNAAVEPAVERSIPTGTAQNSDDVVCYLGINQGAGRATDGFYLGEGAVAATSEWIVGYSMDAPAEYGFLVGPNATIGRDDWSGYGGAAFDCSRATFTNATDDAIRLKNARAIKSYNAAAAAFVHLASLGADDRVKLAADGTGVDMGGHTTFASGKGITFTTGTTVANGISFGGNVHFYRSTTDTLTFKGQTNNTLLNVASNATAGVARLAFLDQGTSKWQIQKTGGTGAVTDHALNIIDATDSNLTYRIMSGVPSAAQMKIRHEYNWTDTALDNHKNTGVITTLSGTQNMSSAFDLVDVLYAKATMNPNAGTNGASMTGIVSDVTVSAARHGDNEIAFGRMSVQDATTTGTTHATIWGLDSAVHGCPVDEQNRKIKNIVAVANTHCGSSPTHAPAACIEAVTGMNRGPSFNANIRVHTIDAGISIHGYAGDSNGISHANAEIGFKFGLKIGGTGAWYADTGWTDTDQHSRIGEGIRIMHYETAGIKITNRSTIGGTSPPAISIGWTDAGAASAVAMDGIDFGGDVSLYRSAANRLKTDDSMTVAGSQLLCAGEVAVTAAASGNYMTYGEQTTDAPAPSANQARVYAKDVGGKTALFVRFNTGAVQQIAIEP